MKDTNMSSRRRMFKTSFAIVVITMSATSMVATTPDDRRAHASESELPQEVVDQVRASETPRGDHQSMSGRYALMKGDTFDVILPVTPEFNQTITIQPDGYITLANAVDLSVAGKTIPQLRQMLIASYSGILHNPVINVIVKDFEKPYFIASGEVSRPGKYDLRSSTTLVEAIAISGGFTDNAKHSQVVLFRRVSDDWIEVKQFNVKQMFHLRSLEDDTVLQPGDMVFVPRSRMADYRRYIPNPGLGMSVVGPY